MILKTKITMKSIDFTYTYLKKHKEKTKGDSAFSSCKIVLSVAP